MESFPWLFFYHLKIVRVVFFWFCGNPFTFHAFKKAMRVTPSLSQRGREPRRNIPSTPFLHLSRFQREFLVNLQRAIILFMNASTGAEATAIAAQKSVRTIFQ
jgi:hypothetical protein